MKLFDTHAHLQFEKFDTDRDEVVKRNSEQLTAVVNPGAKLDSSEKGVALAQRIDNFYAGVGVHPHHSREWSEDWLAKLETLIQQPKVVAAGEIGLDLYPYRDYPTPDIKLQTKVLVSQIELAVRYNKPILFHCRLAYDELYEVIKEYRPLNGLIHCFMGDKNIARKFVDLGLMISFAGNLTYKSNGLMRQAAAYIPEEFLVTETDSPYLAPEPLRGQRNEPVNVAYVVEAIATVKKIETEQVANFSVINARKLFLV